LKTTLIIDIGNNSFGNFETAKELVRVGIECGADLIKGQAFLAKDISGSMPKEFYKQCQFSEEQLIELVHIARYHGRDMFFSIFSPGFEELRSLQNFHKITASQSKGFSQEKVDVFGYDQENFIISSRYCLPVVFKHATVLWATEYLPETIDMNKLYDFRAWFNKFGFSDHTLGIKNCIIASEMGANIIEKHFTLKKELYFDKYKFRDTIHAMNPYELEKLAKAIK
jgi:sialic acid synthase SpsE